MIADQQTSKYENIIKKAKECRSNKDKLLLHDTSYKSLQRRRKPNLSQSFIMRQTVALSAKNKQLVNALTQTKLQNAELDMNLRKMQEKLMMIIMKLNSREVALESCLQELESATKSAQAKDELYATLYNQMHLLLNRLPTPTDIVDCNSATQHSPVNFSFQPKRVLKTKPSLSMTPKQGKWKPDLSMVQEKHQDDLDALQDVETSPLSLTETSPNFNEDFGVETPLITPEQCLHTETEFVSSTSVTTSQLDAELARKRKERRRTSIFSISSFDPNDASFDFSDPEEVDIEPQEKENTSLETQEKENMSDEHDKVVAEVRNESPDLSEENSKANAEPIAVAKKAEKKPKPKTCSKRTSKNFANTSFDDQVAPPKNSDTSTLYLDQTMDFTNPGASEIVTTKPKKQTKATRKPRKSKAKGSVRFREDSVPKEKDVYNCSSDSFLLNPDKKIEISKQKNTGKSKSLPIADITNEVLENATNRGRRRTAACVSYKEPSLNKKLRRGDRFFAASSGKTT